MRSSMSIQAVVFLMLAACGGGSSEEAEASSMAMVAGEVRSEGRLLRNADPVRDQYIVVLKPGASAARDVHQVGLELAGRYHGKLERSFRHALRGFVVDMKEADARALASHPSVAYVEEDGWVYPTDVQQEASWGLDRVDQRDLPLNESYQYNTAGKGVHVYVVDTGIRASHSEFGGRASLDHSEVYDGGGASDCNGHGTHVAGTIGGATWGVAKGVRLHSVRVFGCSGGAPWSSIISAVDWVTANHLKPAVVNMSLGGGATQSVDDAIRNSIAAGITYAVAAGNESVDACTRSPARTPEAITVGATDNFDVRAGFSNHGSCVDLFAPGVSITSAWYDSDTSFRRINGTSMATPHVAGAAALFLENSPAATPAQVASALARNSTMDHISDAGPGSPNRLLYTSFIEAGSPITCKGSTTPGATAWQQYSDHGPNALFLDVDTSACGFPTTPLYFASMGGISNHWTATGATAIYAPTATGFRVYVRSPTNITPQEANQRGWRIHWQAAANNLRQPDTCTGRTTPGATAWQQYSAYGPNALFLDVDTSACGFSAAPLYFTSMGGTSNHWMATGATAIYTPTATGFRVYIRSPTNITPQEANQRGWHLNWQAAANNLRWADTCTGRTTPGATAWQQYSAYGPNALFLDVDTSACGSSTAPLYFTSMGGGSNHWVTTGATAIYTPTATGFRVYLHNPTHITPQEANQRGWHINWRTR